MTDETPKNLISLIVIYGNEKKIKFNMEYHGGQDGLEKTAREARNKIKLECGNIVQGDLTKIKRSFEQVEETISNSLKEIIDTRNNAICPFMLLDIFFRLLMLLEYNRSENEYYFVSETFTLPFVIPVSYKYKYHHYTPCRITLSCILHYKQTCQEIPTQLPIIDIEKRTCRNCRKVSEKNMKKCKRCLTARYCSDECHKEGWKKEHKDVCQPCVDFL